jgi:type IV pilus assembly protein PilB
MESDDTQDTISVASKEDQGRLQEKMDEIRLKEKEHQAQSKADAIGVSYINLKGFPIAPEVLSLITKQEAADAEAVPFFQHQNEIRIGVIDPLRENAQAIMQRLAQSQRAHVVPYMISKHSLGIALHLYDAIPHPRPYVAGVHIDETEIEKFRKQVTTLKALGELMGATNFANLVTLMVAGALESRSSDIHVEAESDDIKVRFRIDGVLHDIVSLHREVWKQLINRLKLLAKVKLNITDKPQDGRFTIFLAKEEIDVRVSFLPTGYGESVVMRILRSSAASLILDDLGLRGQALEILKKEILRPNGMLLTTGPTGSGKTTTLYAVLNGINSPDSKIITLENPIEYHLKGVNQSQVDETAGYTFAKGLRSILRQDPDIVMVGEIRDEETAEIAVNAALTGHLVLSTLHTNNAAGAIPRFIAMGVKPYLLAPALNTVIAQRLVRRICDSCKEPVTPDPASLQRAKDTLTSISPKANVHIDVENLKFFHGKGCPSCQGIGYKGRVGIYELFNMSPAIEKLMLSSQVSEYDMERIAIEQGMITMLQDGILKALDGITSIEEVFKVAQ